MYICEIYPGESVSTLSKKFILYSFSIFILINIEMIE